MWGVQGIGALEARQDGQEMWGLRYQFPSMALVGTFLLRTRYLLMMVFVEGFRYFGKRAACATFQGCRTTPVALVKAQASRLAPDRLHPHHPDRRHTLQAIAHFTATRSGRVTCKILDEFAAPPPAAGRPAQGPQQHQSRTSGRGGGAAAVSGAERGQAEAEASGASAPAWMQAAAGPGGVVLLEQLVQAAPGGWVMMGGGSGR